ncbi:hypothetical protein [Desulfoluna spongiiphila]|uniref:hypothetical protein n=1 Tax=Desulfoluna spongiiphila TaxID=419481 RepID=UPI00125290F1|nr:hypothetical protein [Desulfoluna spongiiphila]VVS95324.1 hypothetical protein DBB_49010 [Desulfoluna spongiiphila]
MKERPILFGPAMVRAILNGRKTQTRRIVKPPFELHANGYLTRPGKTERLQPYPCPYGQVGGWLWVRETFFESGHSQEAYPGDDEFSTWIPSGRVHYAADGLPPISGENKWAWPVGSKGRPTFTPDYGDNYWRKKPSIHMPRKHSRITLEITRKRLQYLQDITEADAEKEGVGFLRNIPDADETLTSRDLFEILWDSINKKRGYEWESNPLVWVVDFKVMEMEG